MPIDLAAKYPALAAWAVVLLTAAVSSLLTLLIARRAQRIDVLEHKLDEGQSKRLEVLEEKIDDLEDRMSKVESIVPAIRDLTATAGRLDRTVSELSAVVRVSVERNRQDIREIQAKIPDQDRRIQANRASIKRLEGLGVA